MRAKEALLMCVKACEEKRDLAERKQKRKSVFTEKRVRIERIKKMRRAYVDQRRAALRTMIAVVVVVVVVAVYYIIL